MSRRHRNQAKMEDVDWHFVCDAVFGFLASPLWNLPVLTFMEENCMVFDPDDDQPETYKEIHGKYKDMVDGLLNSFVKDVGITSEQFVQACTRSNSGQNNGIHKSMFEQILAADDYEMFKRLMIQKNIELQLQALRLIQQRSGVLPDSLVQSGQPQAPPQQAQSTQAPPQQAQSTQAQLDEEALFQEVLRKSKEEYEKQEKAKSNNKEKELHSKLEKEVVKLAPVESKRLEEKAIKQKENVEKHVSVSLGSGTTEKPAAPPSVEKTPKKQDKQSPKPKSDLPPVTTKAPKTSAEAASSWLESAKAEAAAAASTSTSAPTSSISEEEMKQRAEYLKEQRDKLLALKKQEREKKLDSFAKTEPTARPTSARAAKRILVQDKPESSEPETVNKEEQEKNLAMRRALAARLKQEVIEKR